METSYALYYDMDKIKIGREGQILNEEESIYIAEYDENGNFIRRVDRFGDEVEMDISVDDMERMDFIGDGEDTPQESYSRFMDYFEEKEDDYEPTCTMVPYGDTWVEYWC